MQEFYQDVFDIEIEMARDKYPIMHVARLGVATTMHGTMNIGYSKSSGVYFTGYDVWNYPYCLRPVFEYASARELLEDILEDNLYEKLIHNVVIIELQRLDDMRRERRNRNALISKVVGRTVSNGVVVAGSDNAG